MKRKKTKKSENRREYLAKKTSEYSAKYRRIAPIPKVADRKRRDSCEHDLRLFMETYFKSVFSLPWSQDHITIISCLQDVVLLGGLQMVVTPRGFGKSSMVEIATLWSLLYGHRKYVVPMGATDGAAKSMLESLKTSLESNEMLAGDFPAAIFPIQALEHVNQRAASQLSDDGTPTNLEFSRKRIVFPTIEGSNVSGSIIEPRGLTSAIRGMKHKREDGSIIRPDLVLIDDPQTRESAESPTQVQDRMRLVNEDILGLAGPGSRISGIILGTIIRKSDLIDELLSDDNPAWIGKKMSMVYKWPESQETLWQEYAAIRKESLIEGDRKNMRANEFYLNNREDMDRGAIVQWEARKNSDELSALQSAENLLIDRGSEAFFNEYMNEPKRGKSSLYNITRETVLKALNGLPRYQIPDNAHFVSVMVDVNQIGLHYVAAAFCNDMTCSILDYGKYPGGEGNYLWRIDDTKGRSEAQAIYTGIIELAKIFSEPRFFKADRKPIRQNLLTVDCGYLTDTICMAVNSLKNKLNIIASRGRGSKTYKAAKVIGRPGDGWHVSEWAGKGRVLIHNADFWRMNAQKAFLLPPGAPGSCSIFGNDIKEHSKFASHVTAEILHELIHGDVCDYYNWHRIPGESNDLLDALVGTYVGASALGASLSGGEASWRSKKVIRRETRKPVVPMSED